MPDIGIPLPYELLFVTAVHWRLTLALVAVLAVTGVVVDRWLLRVVCFVAALLLGGRRGPRVNLRTIRVI